MYKRQHPIRGKITVNPDCSFTENLHIKDIGAALAKGAYFNEGKEAYGMAVGVEYSFCHSERIGR